MVNMSSKLEPLFKLEAYLFRPYLKILINRYYILLLVYLKY